MTEGQRTCPGCGVPLQSEDEQAPGYVPAAALEREDVICRRCFRIKHYNEAAEVKLDDREFLQILHGIGNSKGLVVQIVDLVDFNGSLIPGIHRFIGKNPLLLVGNKLDVLPKAINQERVKRWIREQAREWGLKPADIVLISGLKGSNMGELAEKIQHYREGKDVFVVGTTNVGKSTVINRLLKEFGEGTQAEITTSRFPGTTLGLIEIPLDGDSSLFDTPGVLNPQQIAHLLDPRELKYVIPAKRINPKVYQLTEGQTLFFGALARFDFVKGEPQPFVIYLSNLLPVHRTKSEKADAFYERHKGQLLHPPMGDNAGKLPPWTRHRFSLPKGGKRDIAICGLGWVALQGAGAVVDVYAPQGVGVQIRKSLI